MPWITVIWLTIAAASAAIALIYGYAWIRLRRAHYYGALALCAASVSMVTLLELGMIRTADPAAFGHYLWLIHFPLWMATAASVLFVLTYMNAGRRWLAWVVIGLRSMALLANVLSSPNLSFREIHAVGQMQVFGESVSFAVGTPNPLLLIAMVAALVLVLFIVDAALEVWRRGDRRLALAVGGLLSFFILLAVVTAVLRLLGLIDFPAMITISCIPIIFGLAVEVSRGMAQLVGMSARLAARHAELEQSEASLQLAAETARVALWSVNMVTGETWLTPTAADMFGYAPQQQLSSTDLLARVHPEDRQRVAAALRAIAKGDTAPVEYRVQLPDGDERWYRSMGSRQQAEQTTAAKMDPVVTGVTADITARRRAELESEYHRAQLDQLERVASASEFSAVMVHELSQPLAIIMSNAEAARSMLQRPAPDFAELREMLADIRAAGERAFAVLSRTRQLPLPDELERRSVSMNLLITQVLEMMRGDLAERHISVTTALADALPAVACDPLLIEQVLFNVVRNASESMSANDPAARVLQISTCLRSDRVEISVCDQGPGWPADSEQVFQPFYTTKADGLGLGLPICRAIVQAHDGSITAQANGARGACICIALPLSPLTASELKGAE